LLFGVVLKSYADPARYFLFAADFAVGVLPRHDATRRYRTDISPPTQMSVKCGSATLSGKKQPRRKIDSPARKHRPLTKFQFATAQQSTSLTMR
jgi:hypothetical protein